MCVPRLQLFEWQDLPWVPGFIREAIVESLGAALTRGHVLAGLRLPFCQYVERSGADSILDLCSGNGGAAFLLGAALGQGRASSPRLLLTDLHPQPASWSALAARRPGSIDYVPEPVDATRVEESLARGRPRLIVNAFHHFPPEVARSVIHDACRQGRGLFIAEVFERGLLATLPMGVHGLIAVLLNPLRAPRNRLLKALFTWLIPVIPIGFLWDGLISSLRIYNERELHEMASGIEGFEWVYGRFAYQPVGRGMYFAGTPKVESRA